VHQHDAGQRLEWAVVERDRQSPSLVLLGRDELRRETITLGVVSRMASSKTEERAADA
jgi:hypothetical protein